MSLGSLLLTSALIWRDDIRRGRATSLSEVPAYVVIGDLVAAALWMAASAPNLSSVAFVVVLAIGALAMFRLGTVGVALTAGAYVGGRVVQEAIRLWLGLATPVPQVVAEVVVVGLVLIILAATVGHYRSEQQRGDRALRLARSLERIANEIGEVTDLTLLFRGIVTSALGLLAADHAIVRQRRGEEYWIVAGAGTGERVVGTRSPKGRGIVGLVVERRAAVALDDYA
ncbi:MAG TPA: hypothetical protein VFW12_02010, partial [Candidatus Limnocylindria bacterium]|nr:hypothetical protein [Candidatus Limnocylindria bacterium]